MSFASRTSSSNMYKKLQNTTVKNEEKQTDVKDVYSDQKYRVIQKSRNPWCKKIISRPSFNKAIYYVLKHIKKTYKILQ
jgi:hypothetical protein